MYNIKNVNDCRDAYDSWATTFDEDVLGPSQDYVAHTYVAEAVKGTIADITTAEVLDAGCGTGLSGAAVVEAGARTVDGVDLSPGMLKVAAKRGIYRRLGTADLSKAIPDTRDASYDVVVCVGTLTHGHVGPVPALREFVRIVKSGGCVAATIIDDIWASGGYEAEVNKLKGQGLVEIVSSDSKDYRKAAGVSARILVLRKT